MSGQPIEEYRGCVILLYPGLDPIRFGSPCTVYLRWTVEKVKEDIDAYRDVAPEEPEEPPEPEPTYICPHCGAAFYTFVELSIHIQLAHPPEPEPPEEDTFIETYRDYKIYRRPDEGMFYAVITPLITVIALTLIEIKLNIDLVLLDLYPPEEPPGGLLGQVVAALKAWFLENIQPWVTQWGKVFQDFVTYVDDSIHYWGDQVTQFIDNSITYIDDSINYWGDQITQYIDESVHYVDESINYWGDQVTQNITNVTNNFNEFITNNTYQTIEYITNVIGVLDPLGFLKDPMGYISGVWNLLIDPWAHGVVKSFWEGLEEGLEE